VSATSATGEAFELPRERVLVPGPTACACCGSTRLSKLGEDITETLEVIPRQWKVIQHVREKFTCRACEKISQAPAPFHVIARGRAGPSLLAMILYAKFALHQPLNRQSQAYAREGAELIGAHVFAAARIHGDDTPVPLLAKGKTVQARLWAYVRDDRPFGGPDPPAAVYHAIAAASAPSGISRTTAAFCRPTPMQASTRSIRTTAPLGRSRRRHVGRMQEGSFSFLQTLQRRPGPVIVSPIALEAVRRLDVIFEWERSINGLPPAQRLAVREKEIAPIVEAFEVWMRAERARLSRHAEVAKAMDYMLKRWTAFTRFLADGRICLSNNAAERALRGIALGRKSWLFAGSERGGERAAIMDSLIQTAMLNGVDPQAWLADVLNRIADHPITDLPAMLPWSWKKSREIMLHAAAAA